MTPMNSTVNWIGLWTIVRREWSRLMRVPVQAFIAPWISALLFIFIFGFVVGKRIALIGGHHYLEFVLPGILMLNILNAAFLQSSSQIYFSRFLRHGDRHSHHRGVLRRHACLQYRRIPVLDRDGVGGVRASGQCRRAVGEQFR